MCGFAALFEPGRSFSPGLLAGLDQDLYHRGPDSGGVLAEPGRALVFRRLAIIDPVATSDQPMEDADRRFALVFNGEIYNFRELRRELEGLGVKFRSGGDTEVLLQGWAQWGESLLDRLVGMYAFVIVDRHRRLAFAARDPLGIKPLYMLRHGALTAFASELRPLARLRPAEPDPTALAELLVFRFAAGRASNLKDIERIPGGGLVTLSLEAGQLSERRFFDVLDTFNPNPEISPAEAERLAQEALVTSVADHLQSDVGYTLQLSGGVDSSLITAIASVRTGEPLRTFGVSLGDIPQDERRWRDMVSARYPVVHEEVALSGNAYANALPRAIRHMEGPIAHSGCPMLMLLCDRIREVSPVVLTGEGADEFFGGYMRYRIWKNLRSKGRLAKLVPPVFWPVLQRYREIQRYSSNRHPAVYASVYHDFLRIHECFPDLVPDLGARGVAAGRFKDFRDQLFAVDQTTYLDSLLLRQDKMAMAASVEARVPFTHLPLARLVNSFPHSARLFNDQTKPLLKRIAEKYLQSELIHRRKVGLVLPVTDWLAEPEGLGRYLDLLDSPNSRLLALGDARRIRQAVQRFRAGQRGGLPPLEHLVNMELWLRSLDEK